MVWEPRTCCCGASVRVGTLIIGWLTLIGCSMHVMSSLKFVGMTYDDYRDVCSGVIQEHGAKEIKDADTCAKIVLSTIAISSVLSCIGATISILLLVGVYKGKPKLMIPFMLAKVTQIVLTSLLALLLFLLLVIKGAVDVAFVLVIIGILMVSLEVYFILIIRVCYKETKHHSDAVGTESSIPYVEQAAMNQRC